MNNLETLMMNGISHKEEIEMILKKLKYSAFDLQ
jgi:hypothetical protein